MSSDDDGADLMASFKKGERVKPSPRAQEPQSFSPSNFISDQSSGDDAASKRSPVVARKAVAVRAAPVRNRSEYKYYEPVEEKLAKILREYSHKGDLLYEVKLVSGATKQVSKITRGFVKALHGP
jgi:chromodomain-helicase-DNA-binding protein 4